jgi:hypothetical protein
MLFAAATMVFSSCQGEEKPEPKEEPIEEPVDPGEEELDPTSPWFSKTVSWTIGAEAPSVWAAGDSIRVFDHDFVRIKFTTEGSGASASFSTNEWTGYKPACAVFCEGIVYCNTDEGIIRQIPVPATQKLEGANDCVRYAFPAVGKAEEDGETNFKLPSMKNVTARIKFTFQDSKTKALTIKGMEDEQLAGKINVKYEDVSWSAVEGTEENTITLLPAGDAFTAGSTVYASVLPGTFAKGFKVTVTNLEDLNVGRAFFTEEGIKVDRNAVVELPDAIDTPQSPWKSSVTSINVGTEGPSAFAAGDAISVYDFNGAAVSFTTDAATVPANFSTTEWTGEKPTYAVFTTGTPTLTVADADATFGVTVPSQQKIDAGAATDHAAMPSVAAVEPDETVDYKITSMSNAAGRIALTFQSGTKAKSVKIQGMDGEALAGAISLKLSDLNCTVTSPETSVIITPDGDSFTGGSTVYATVLPGTYAKGLRFTVTDTDNQVIENIYGEETGIVVTRNQDTILPDVVDAKPLSFPEEFVVHVDFTKAWPFQEAWSAGTNEYSFEYSDGLPLTFKLENADSYAAGLPFSGTTGKIYLPQVEGRFLNSVVVVHEMTGAKAFELHKASDDSRVGVRHTTSVWKGPVPVAKFSPHLSELCYLSMLTASTTVTHIYLRYTSSAEGSDAVKLGYESPYNTWNQNTNGDTYTNDGTKSCFVGVYARNANTNNTLDDYSFTQTVNGKDYTFTALRPTASYSMGDLFCWANGLWSGAMGADRYLKLPHTGKLVWIRVDVGNSTNGSNGKLIRFDAKDKGETEYTTVGEGVYLGATAYGLKDGSSAANNAEFWTWCLDDAYSPTKDYYLFSGNGSTWMDEMVLIYL